MLPISRHQSISKHELDAVISDSLNYLDLYNCYRAKASGISWNFSPHQLFTFAIGSSFLFFVIRNPFSQASFLSITSSLTRHSPFGVNERLGS